MSKAHAQLVGGCVLQPRDHLYDLIGWILGRKQHKAFSPGIVGDHVGLANMASEKQPNPRLSIVRDAARS